MPCKKYEEDSCITYDDGEPKGQCANCGDKWYEHDLEALPEHEREGALEIREYQHKVQAALEKTREPYKKKE